MNRLNAFLAGVAVSTVSVSILYLGCLSTPHEVTLYDGEVTAESPGYDIRLADYDNDGTLDVYSVRSERCTSFMLNGCAGEGRYRHWVVITKGGSNGGVELRRVEWTSNHKITATGWATGTGDLAVKVNGRWEVVPWTAPKGRVE